MNLLRKSFVSISFLSIIFVFGSLAQSPTNSTREAAECMSRGDIKGAIAVLDKAVEQKKDLLEVYRMRSSLRFFNGDIPGGIADLDKVIEIKPDGKTFSERAYFKTFLRDTDGALRDYDSAIANGYKIDRAFVGRGNVKSDKGDLEGAIEDFTTAIGLNPTSAQAHVALASALSRVGKNDGAIEILEGFLEVYEGKRDGKLPKSKMEPTGISITIKDEKSENEESQRYISGQMMKTSDNSPEDSINKHERIMNIALAYANLAQMLEKKGEFERALVDVQKSISINSNDFYPIGLRGKILLDLGKLKESLIDLNTAIRLMPSVSTHYADRGILLLILGKNAEAQSDFDKFLKLAPRAEEYLKKRIANVKEKSQ
jgi:tetratricopeptide (TPR) repeat protein